MSHQDDKSPSRLVVIGRLGRVHGVQGWLNVISYTQPPENIRHYLPWQILIHGQWQHLSIDGIQQRDQQLLVRFNDYTQRETAQQLTNCEIGIRREQLPALSDAEYYWTDLLGLKVINQTQQELGIIDDFYETGANDVMIVKHGNQQYWIPYLPKLVVKTINLQQGFMVVDWESDF